MEIKCQHWLATLGLIAIVLLLNNSVSVVEAGKKKDKGLIIVLSNGGCGGNIVVQTGKDGKKGGGGHKILVKGGDSGGGCGCSNSCGSCGGGGHDHHQVQHVPIPIPIPPGHPIPPAHEMHAAMMSQLAPSFSSNDHHSSASSPDSSSEPSDQDTQASDSSSSSTSTSDDTGKESSSSSSSSSTSSKDKSNMVAPLFIPMNVITPPWFQGSPVFMDPSSQKHLSSTIKTLPKEYSSLSSLSSPLLKSSSSSSLDKTNYHSNMEKGEFAQSSNVVPTFNEPTFNLQGLSGQFLTSPFGFQGVDSNPLMSQQSANPEPNKKDLPASGKPAGGGRGSRNSYLQPLINSVQRLIRGPGPLREIEQGLVKQGQRMQASFSNLVPVAITNYTSYLPSLPGLRSSSGNRDRKPSGTTNRPSRYLESLRLRLRPLTMMEGNRLTSSLENLWKNIRSRGLTGPSSSSNQAKSIGLDNNSNNNINNVNSNLPGMVGHIHHHQHPLTPMDSSNGHPISLPNHPNLPGQQNNQVMQQYLEQILTSKWWEWPSGGILGPNLNQY